MVTTMYYPKIGTVEYECSIGRSNENVIETIDSRRFASSRDAEQWGMAEVRRLNAAKDEFVYDAVIRRELWIADNYHDDHFGHVRDARSVTDLNYQSWTVGLTWYDDDNGVPDWDR